MLVIFFGEGFHIRLQDFSDKLFENFLDAFAGAQPVVSSRAVNEVNNTVAGTPGGRF